MRMCLVSYNYLAELSRFRVSMGGVVLLLLSIKVAVVRTVKNR